jgi:hypothetical protein
MRLLPGFLIALLVGTLCVAEDRDGRLVSECASTQRFASMPPAEANRYCRWVVRYEAGGGPEIKDIEGALGDLTPMQPPQIEGDRASVLAKKKSGQIEVVYLEKRDGAWRQVSALIGTGKKTKTVVR